MTLNLSDPDYELISAYIDGQLSEAERRAFEARLQNDLALQRELAVWQQTTALLNALPELPAPRNFTLDARMAQPPLKLSRPARTWRFNALSAAAALVVVMFGLAVMLWNSTPDTANDMIAMLNSADPSAAEVAQVPTLQPSPESAEDLPDDAARAGLTQSFAFENEAAPAEITEQDNLQITTMGDENLAGAAMPILPMSGGGGGVATGSIYLEEQPESVQPFAEENVAAPPLAFLAPPMPDDAAEKDSDPGAAARAARAPQRPPLFIWIVWGSVGAITGFFVYVLAPS